MPDARITYNVFNDRSSHFFPTVGFMKNIFDYFVRWGTSILLLAAGYFSTLRKGGLKLRNTVAAGILLYAAVSILIFRPAWWGAKYGMLLIPFSVLFGLFMFRKLKHGLVAATAISMVSYFCFDTQVSPVEHYGQDFRVRLMESYILAEWKVPGYEPLEEQGELALTMWMNGHIPPGSNILSFYVTKRYFSDHRWMVAWRYPPAARLYLENTLEEEVGILNELEVDYIFTVYGVPAPFDDERAVEIFSRIGPGDLLEPVIELDGHVLLRYNRLAPENPVQ
jgi:hypothetical protein